MWMQGIAQDLRFGVRRHLKEFWFTAAAALALALGIASTSTVFTIVNAVLLKSAPVSDAGSPHRAIDARRTKSTARHGSTRLRGLACGVEELLGHDADGSGRLQRQRRGSHP